jgi:Zn-dependent peptidase ImmA (M78 family)/DNA-binding XRE family transcriptional regulator
VLDPTVATNLPARLRLARRDQQMTQEEVAKALGLARTTIVAIEKGERQVRHDELRALARIYERPLDEFLRPSAPVEELGAQFRMVLPKVEQAPELEGAVRQVERLVEDYVELERLAEVSPRSRYPDEASIIGVDPESAAAEFAQSERNRLGLGDAPVPRLRDILESSVGVRVFALDLPSNVAGLFAYDDRAGACIAFNKVHPYERQQMTLAHEYGHLLVSRHTADVNFTDTHVRRSPAERFAHAFAYEFLLPSSSVIRQFNDVKRSRAGSVTVANLVELALILSVSVEALFRRLEALKLISPGTFERARHQGLRVADAQRALGLAPPPPDDRLLPRAYSTLAINAFQEGKITEGLFARFLRLDRVKARRVAADLAGETATLD